MSNKNNEFISPIAIDLGAKNTGVYFAHYPAGSKLEQIDKHGKVYQLDRGSYTYLMANRTATRHQRRGFDRRQMAKRLFKLIWEKHLDLPWNKDVQQTISFLMNRRGFSYLQEDYDAEVLAKFPQKAFDVLPKEIKVKASDGIYNLASALQEWREQDANTVKLKLDAIWLKICIAKLHSRISDNKKSKFLETEVSKNLLKKLIEDGVKGLSEAENGRYTYTKKGDGENKEYRYTNGDKVNLDAYIRYSGREKEIKNSLSAQEKNWNFDIASFKLEDTQDEKKKKKHFYENDKDDKDARPNIKVHLQHLAFALHRIHEELESGGRHRSKYFEEVESVLIANDHRHSYLKNFYKQLCDGKFAPLNEEVPINEEVQINKKASTTRKKITNLIGHISNLELKPLRKYFNNIDHKAGDLWQEERIAHLFERWILREWRVDKENKDKLKQEGKPGDYKKLKKLWKDFKEKNNNKEKNNKQVVNFWLETDPNLTIPPYQDNNNRRPPKCQSLILNPQYLTDKYPDWREWLKQLKELETVKDYLADYNERLKELKSGKGKKYFESNTSNELRKDLDAHTLQFIFDRVKSSDSLKLNEIYSIAKKIKQCHANDKKLSNDEIKKIHKQLSIASDVPSVTNLDELLQEVMTSSKLPPSLKPEITNYNFSEKGFLHLICKYYKQRQRAKDGRLFIHPEYRYIKGRGYKNTGRFNSNSHLLSYCNHKPRQKRYQILSDVAGLLQIAPQILEKKFKDEAEKSLDERIYNWLIDVRSLKTNCETAAAEQKKRRGSLKLDIDQIYSDNSDKKLRRFCDRAKKLYLDLVKDLYVESKIKTLKNDLEQNPARAVFFLAQLNNIVFKERQGNAKTCPVCSADNAQRMQEVGDSVKAQRLPAISTRIIDGAVMRIARIVGGAIAEDKWQKIESELKEGKSVCVPIITESNRFEFEPNLKTLKGRKSDKESSKSNPIQNKENRIKASGESMCPYCGDDIGKDGEIDHIIPRKSTYGALNDEANLIHACRKCNSNKSNKEYSLNELKDQYKEKQFGTTNDTEITEKIVEKIWNEDKQEFKFGSYRSFINLNNDEQKAFRHALFLKNSHLLKQEVLSAISNRNRTIVNGTQRYFAECLANSLYKKAKKLAHESSNGNVDEERKLLSMLSFDYAQVQPWDESRGKGIKDLRKMYEEAKKLKEYAKLKNGEQMPYSHLIDAQLAFVLCADQHRNEGGLKLEIPKNLRPEPYDKETGEVAEKTFFDMIKVPDTGGTKLRRAKTTKDFFQHKTLFDSNAGAWHFLKLIEIQCDDRPPIYLKGFLCLKTLLHCLSQEKWETEIDSKYGKQKQGSKLLFAKFAKKLTNKKEIEKLPQLYKIGNDKYQFGYKKSKGIYPKKILDNHSINGQTFSVIVHQINHSKVAEFILTNFNTRTSSEDWDEEAVNVYDKLQKLWYFTKRATLEEVGKCQMSGDIYDPSLLSAWSDVIELKEDYEIREYFLKKESKKPHEKSRKFFSLPEKSKGQSFMLIERRTWNGNKIYQCQSEKSGNDGAGKYGKYKNIKTGETFDILLNHFKSEKIALLKKYKEIKEGLKSLDGLEQVNEDKWHSISVPENLKNIVESIENKYQSKGDSNWRVVYEKSITQMKELQRVMEEYPIDEMTIPQIKLGKKYFPEGCSVEDGKEKLEKYKLDVEDNKKKFNFSTKWLEVLNSIQPDKKTLEYKRSVGLKIEQPNAK